MPVALDGAGNAKMETLERAQTILQSLHSIVEQMALAEKGKSPTTAHVQRLKRTATPLVGLLKGQFGMISDVAATLILVATRGASEKARVRGLRECVASLRAQLEIAQKKVIEQHAQKSTGSDGEGTLS